MSRARYGGFVICQHAAFWGDSEGVEKGIRSTNNHEFFSIDRNDWFRAENLQAGEKIETRTGFKIVASVTRVPGKYNVFNIEVDGTHTYFVGKNCVYTPNAKKAYRTLTEDEAYEVLEGKDILARGEGKGEIAMAQTVGGAKRTRYLPVSEVPPHDLTGMAGRQVDTTHWVEFDTTKVGPNGSYISKAELLKNPKLDAQAKKWVEQQQHGLVKDVIPRKAITKATLFGVDMTEDLGLGGK